MSQNVQSQNLKSQKQLSTSAPNPPLVRAGLVLFALLSLGDVATLALTDGKHPPYSVAVLGVVLGVASLCLLVPAWRGNVLAARALAVLRIVSALTALPAFFVSGAPAPAVGSAAAIIVLTVVALLLVIGGRRTRTVAAR